MSTLGTVLSTAGGVAAIALAGRDIFDALFHPEGRGNLARGVARAVWRAFAGRAGDRRPVSPLAGPLALLAVIGTWALLLVLGWALIYWPQLPDGFRSGGGAPVGDGFAEAVHVSLVLLTTLGLGDVVPGETWLRVVAPLESLLGFGLLSASVSWLLLIYPVLGRRRALAYEIALLRQEEREMGHPLDERDPEALERLYAELAGRLMAVERDLVNFPITYYFAEADPRFSLPAVAPYLLELVERGDTSERPDGLRFRAGVLREALDDLARTTADRFHRSGRESTAELLDAYAHDHGAALQRTT